MHVIILPLQKLLWTIFAICNILKPFFFVAWNFLLFYWQQNKKLQNIHKKRTREKKLSPGSSFCSDWTGKKNRVSKNRRKYIYPENRNALLSWNTSGLFVFGKLEFKLKIIPFYVFCCCFGRISIIKCKESLIILKERNYSIREREKLARFAQSIGSS